MTSLKNNIWLLIFLFLPSVAFCQQPAPSTGNFSLLVINEELKPLRGATVELLNNAERPKFSFDEYYKACSMFFYVYDYDSSGFKGKVCGGVNPFLKEKIKVNPYLEGFTFTALIKILAANPKYFVKFNNTIKQLNQEVLIKGLKGNEAISFGKQERTRHFFRIPN